MAKLRLHQELYSTSAVQCALDAFRDVCTATLASVPPYHVLEITSDEQAQDATIASELSNYALATSVEEHRK